MSNNLSGARHRIFSLLSVMVKVFRSRRNMCAEMVKICQIISTKVVTDYQLLLLLLCSQSWVWRNKNESRIDALEMRSLRSMRASTALKFNSRRAPRPPRAPALTLMTTLTTSAFVIVVTSANYGQANGQANAIARRTPDTCVWNVAHTTCVIRQDTRSGNTKIKLPGGVSAYALAHARHTILLRHLQQILTSPGGGRGRGVIHILNTSSPSGYKNLRAT
ncbi:hypothetical protein EVAR_31199_1 [Eumeta japonica]|uniref:Uncharacterized protein n=1 Tax=Eumeta variegata TaxID=151549 RepID=A0A4C1VZR1_EUMVA|nr:hypothetical protein EVAR_31199_1 [Eumeta japonica]